MIKIENSEVLGWDHAIRGMRNPMNSWDKSDSGWDTGWPSDHGILVDSDSDSYYECRIGPNDQELMLKLAKAGSVHAKYRRMIVVYADITAPLYWWKEFDTYKVGTVANSCSTMHKIHAKEFELDDFSHDHLLDRGDLLKPEERFNLDDMALSAVSVNGVYRCYVTPERFLQMTCNILNRYRTKFLETKDKRYWWQMIQLLPSSYNQKRTVMLNYEVLAHMYHDRKDHKLDEWREFCKWIEGLPCFEIIVPEEKEKPISKLSVEIEPLPVGDISKYAIEAASSFENAIKRVLDKYFEKHKESEDE